MMLMTCGWDESSSAYMALLYTVSSPPNWKLMMMMMMILISLAFGAKRKERERERERAKGGKHVPLIELLYIEV